MKVVELVFNSTAVTGVKNLEEKVLYLKDSLKVQYEIMGIAVALENYINSTDKSFNSGIELVMDTERLLTIDTSSMEKLSTHYLPSLPSLRRRVRGFLELFSKCKEIVEEQSDAFVPYLDETSVVLMKLLKECLGQISCFIYHQFGFSELLFVDSIDEIEEIYDTMDAYMRSNSFSLKDMINIAIQLKTCINIANPLLGVFERYPELLEPFERLVGADLFDSANLDIKTIMSVIDGTTSITDFQVLLQELEEDGKLE
ncbi:MAG: hypothetical protein ACRC5M_07260 [Anaeroplasmataceae bacterium]